MNFIFEAYSNVYSAAMMAEPHAPSHAATAKKRGLVAKIQAMLAKN
jgi:hypothetical protein